MVKVKGARTLRLPARASVYYTLAAIVGRGIGVIGTPVFTRLLNAGEYGLYPLYNTWLSIFTVIATLEITGGCMLRAHQRYENQRGELTAGAFGLISLLTLGLSVIYFSLFPYINRLTGLSTRVSLIMLLQIYMTAIINLYTAGAKFTYSYKRVCIINTLLAFLAPIFSVILIEIWGLGGEGRILGGAIATAAIALPLSFIVLRGGRLYNKDIWRYLLKMTIPLLPHYLAVAAILRVGEITVGRVHGTAALAKYSVAMSLGFSLSMITGAVLSVLGPWILRRIRLNDFKKIKSTLYILTRGLCLLSLIFLSVVPETIRILTPPEYHDALIAVYPLLISAVPLFLSSAITHAQLYYEKSALTSLPAICAGAVSTLLSVLLLPRLDFRFVGLFVLISYIILLIENVIVFKSLAGRLPIDVKKTSSIYLLTVIYSGLLCALRFSITARLLLALPLIPLTVKTAIDGFKEVKEIED